MNRSPLRLGFLLNALAGLLALSLQAQTCQEGCDLGNGNTFLGDNALISNTTGSANTAFGFYALLLNTTGYDNTAVGADALRFNTTGNDNTAIGLNTLQYESAGMGNTAIGAWALDMSTGGDYNTATGYQALGGRTFAANTGSNNTADGANVLSVNTTGNDNTGIGNSALYSNAHGSSNTAIGSEALFYNVIGSNNTAIGYDALHGSVGVLFTGSSNTATGFQALYSYTTGSANTANGHQALYNATTGQNNTADGVSALFDNTTGSNNIAVGAKAGFALTSGSNNIDIGNPGNAGESDTIRIGDARKQTNAFIAGISGATVPGGVEVIVGINGKLGTVVSSERFKDEIKPMDKASEAILALKPVTFRYKRELDPDGIPQFGLVAEDVEKVNPDLVARDEQGKPYTVRYEAVNAMLLNEFLKEHRTVQELKCAAAKQEATIAKQQKQIEALTAGLQKVSAQVEASRRAQQMVVSNP